MASVKEEEFTCRVITARTIFKNKVKQRFKASWEGQNTIMGREEKSVNMTDCGDFVNDINAY